MTVSGKQVEELAVVLTVLFAKRRVHPVLAYLAMSMMAEELRVSFNINVDGMWDGNGGTFVSN